MRLTVLGGGGFRVPLVYQALLAAGGELPVTEVVLHDVDPARLRRIRAVLAALADGSTSAPAVTATTDLDQALDGTAFVFSAVRVGGLEGRAADERIAVSEGVLGQETVGAGGIAYGLRTVPEALRIAERVRTVAPDAWVVNFTNPAGLVTEAMTRALGDRVIGICDSPAGLCRRVARTLGVEPALAWFDYAGLNHLGWLRAVRVGDRDLLPGLLADAAAATAFEEGALFGADLLRTLRAVPNEYLYYYYFNRESRADRGDTRGTFLLEQQRRFYRDCGDADPLAAWQGTRLEREATYMADSREASGAGDRDERDLAGGGYERVALALMRAIARDERTTLILNVRNRSALRSLDEHAVVEVPCQVDGNGARPFAMGDLGDHEAGLVRSVKAVERATIEAAVAKSRDAALRAFALHPLVDSAAVASRLLDRYVDVHAELGYLRPRRTAHA